MQPLMSPAGAGARALICMAFVLAVLIATAVLTLHSEGGGAAYACNPGDPDCQPTISVGATESTGGSGGSEGTSACYRGDVEVPCQTDDGTWYSPYQCYIKAVPRDQWPPAIDPVYGGADPASGSVYWCTQDWTGANRLVFFPGTPPVDPTVLVRQAVATLDLEPIAMGTAPRSGPDHRGLVGLPTWMWVQDPDMHTFGPVTTNASDGGLSVTVTAEVVSVDWDMGDGTATVHCAGPSTPYDTAEGNRDSPDCGHHYAQTSEGEPGNAFTVTATSSWQVTWSASNGARGVMRFTRQATTQLRIGEMQVLVQ